MASQFGHFLFFLPITENPHKPLPGRDLPVFPKCPRPNLEHPWQRESWQAPLGNWGIPYATSTSMPWQRLAGAVLYEKALGSAQNTSYRNMKPSTSIVSRAVTAPPRNSNTPIPSPPLPSDEAMAGCNSECEENGAVTSLCLRAHPHFASTLHELANSVTALLINTQVLDWKLPPYSHLKRPVREIERHAQRSSTLVKRLLSKFEAMEEVNLESCQQVPSLRGPMLRSMTTVGNPGLVTTEQRPAKLPARVLLPPAPGSSTAPKSNSHRHVTGALAPASQKRNDGYEY